MYTKHFIHGLAGDLVSRRAIENGIRRRNFERLRKNGIKMEGGPT